MLSPRASANICFYIVPSQPHHGMLVIFYCTLSSIPTCMGSPPFHTWSPLSTPISILCTHVLNKEIFIQSPNNRKEKMTGYLESCSVSVFVYVFFSFST